MPAYSAVLKSSDYKSARSSKPSSREQARAELLMTLLTADDSNAAWQALGGKSEAPPSSPSVDKLIAQLDKSSEEDADILALAAEPRRQDDEVRRAGDPRPRIQPAIAVDASQVRDRGRHFFRSLPALQ